MVTGKGAGAHLDPDFQGFGAHIGTPAPRRDDHMDFQAGSTQPHRFGAVEHHRADVSAVEVVFTHRNAGRFVDFVFAERDLHAHDVGRIEQAVSVRLQAENRRALRGFVSAHTFKHAHAVVQCMGQHMGRGIAPRHQLAVIPDHTITISHRHHYAPQRIQHPHHKASGKLDGAYGPAGYVLTALTLCVSQQPSSILARTRCVARVDARRQIDPP